MQDVLQPDNMEENVPSLYFLSNKSISNNSAAMPYLRVSTVSTAVAYSISSATTTA